MHETALLQTLERFLSKAETIQIQCGSQTFGNTNSTEVRLLVGVVPCFPTFLTACVHAGTIDPPIMTAMCTFCMQASEPWTVEGFGTKYLKDVLIAAKHQEDVWVAAAYRAMKKVDSSFVHATASAVDKDIVVAAFMDIVRHKLVQPSSAMPSDSPHPKGSLTALYSAATDMLPVSMGLQPMLQGLTFTCNVWH